VLCVTGTREGDSEGKGNQGCKERNGRQAGGAAGNRVHGRACTAELRASASEESQETLLRLRLSLRLAAGPLQVAISVRPHSRRVLLRFHYRLGDRQSRGTFREDEAARCCSPRCACRPRCAAARVWLSLHQASPDPQSRARPVRRRMTLGVSITFRTHRSVISRMLQHEAWRRLAIDQSSRASKTAAHAELTA
jgi:hypothetical protein